MRQRKDAVEIGHGEQLCPAVFDPLRLGEDLTLGTVAITARVIGVVLESAALIPRCPSMLAQLRNDPVPVKVIADEHQFRHGPVCIGVRMHVAVMGCRVGVRLVMRVMV